MEWRAALSPRLSQYWIELGKQILCVLFFISLFSTLICFYYCHPHCFICLINLLHTLIFYWCDFLVNSQQLLTTFYATTCLNSTSSRSFNPPLITHQRSLFWRIKVLVSSSIGVIYLPFKIILSSLWRVNLEIQYQIYHLLELYLFIPFTVETLLKNMHELLRQ